MSDTENFEVCRKVIDLCREEISRRVVGQKDVVDGILTAAIAGGHVLLEGVPGLAKTLAVRSFADVSGLDFKRIQFTPDLLPADVTGTPIYEQNSATFSVRKGPVFTNVVLADEINRSPAKVQSALLEAMAERQVTIGENTYKLPEPFIVLATQNPIDEEGTYNLPEAELDRFLLKLVVSYPTPEEEIAVVRTCGKAPDIPLRKILDAEKIFAMRKLVDSIKCDDKIVEYIVSIVSATRADKDKRQFKSRQSEFSKYISFGASPRAGIALLQCAKVQALFAGRNFVLPDDVKSAALPVLRHRIVLSYEASADSVTSDELIGKILSLMPAP
ncbi:MAG: MoxR family ATPase [Treponema sp.]|uniref:AAA family ATPase n=1 Tax=Treponema sp. TaxID=166 RepID=UPI00257CFDA8|nr:MoxR family ATPase [Treponema sp.]MBQ5537319.1 MoxR family ATPase [Treponema sp.]